MSKKEKYVSAAKVISYMNKTSGTVSAKLFKKYVNGIIAEDVVAVVRCKDCIRYIEPYCTRFITGMIPVSENDYCSKGDRKESKIKKCFDIPKDVAETVLEDTERKDDAREGD